MDTIKSKQLKTSFTPPKAILVTGCAGFIGSNFVKKFKSEFPKTTIVGIDDLSTGRLDAIGKNITFYKGSILDENFLEKIFKKHKPEYVFHFAAIPRVAYSLKEPSHTTQVNVVGTVNILTKSRDHGVKRVIYSSSSSVYGGAKKLPTTEHEHQPNPKSPYAVQKYVNEIFCKVFSELFGLDTVCLRYFNVFGPGQYGNSPYSTVISAWLESLYPTYGQKKIFIEGDGKQSRDFCFIDNVLLANILAMKNPRKIGGEVFNIAHGERTALNKARKLIEKHTGKKLNLEQRPTRLGDVRHSHADITKAKKWFGYKPQFNFEQGLIKTIDWHKERVATSKTVLL